MTVGTKSPGQVAFESFARLSLAAARARHWESLPSHVQRAWQVVADDLVTRKTAATDELTKKRA